MYTIFYLEVRHIRGTYNYLYYILDFSGNYIGAVESEKIYGTRYEVSEESLIQFIADTLNSLGASINNLVILTEVGSESLVSLLVSKAEDYLYVMRQSPYVVESLSNCCGYKNLSLYSIYCLCFGTPKVHLDKLDLIDRVITHFGIGVSVSAGAYMVVQPRKFNGYYIVSTCWFTINVNGDLHILGSRNGYFPTDADSYVSLNNFVSDIRLSVAECGISLDSITPIYYDKDAQELVHYLFFAVGINLFSVHTGYINLKDRLRIVTEPTLMRVAESSYNLFLRVFSGTLCSSYDFSALDLVGVVGYISSKFGTLELSANNKYYKDFSSDTAYSIDLRAGRFKYAIVVDCEGTSTGGCSEIGGLIFAYDSNMMIKLETFLFRRRDFAVNMLEIVSRFERLSGRLLSTRGIPVLTYGGTDKHFIFKQLLEDTSRGTRRKLDKSFTYIDCQSYIYNYLDRNNIILSNRKQGTVARGLGVEVIMPMHNALNDAKTLFNILARIHLTGDIFII